MINYLKQISTKVRVSLNYIYKIVCENKFYKKTLFHRKKPNDRITQDQNLEQPFGLFILSLASDHYWYDTVVCLVCTKNCLYIMNKNDDVFLFHCFVEMWNDENRREQLETVNLNYLVQNSKYHYLFFI